MSELREAKELLLAGGFTCVILGEGKVFTSQKRGVRPLVECIKAKASFKGCRAADKVVGKATAFLYVLLKIKCLYAGVISKPALQVLKDGGIEVEYSALAENIINRSGDGICPFEQAVMNISDPNVAFRIISEKLKDLQ